MLVVTLDDSNSHHVKIQNVFIKINSEDCITYWSCPSYKMRHVKTRQGHKDNGIALKDKTWQDNSKQENAMHGKLNCPLRSPLLWARRLNSTYPGDFTEMITEFF